jgi:general secretion pathway protein I
MQGECRNQEAGFTLPEIIAALAILTVSLSVLFGLLSDGLRSTSRAEALAEATSLVQSLLDRVGTEMPLRPGTTTGEFADRFRWRLQIEPYGDAADRRFWPVNPHRISATVAWGDGLQERSVALTTLRLAPKEPGL